MYKSLSEMKPGQKFVRYGEEITINETHKDGAALDKFYKVIFYDTEVDWPATNALYANNKSETTSDPVNHPSHYTLGGIETIDFIKAKMTPEQYEGYLLGNVIKYLTRYNHKGNAVQDLEKSQTYLKWLTEHVKEVMGV